MKKYNKLFVGVFLVFIVVIFSAINTAEVSVNFGFAQLDSPLIFIILGSTFLGGLTVVLFTFSNSWQQRRELKKIRQLQADFEEDKQAELAEKEAEITALTEQLALLKPEAPLELVDATEETDVTEDLY